MRHDLELWWDLPQGWEVFTRGQNGVRAYCSSGCNKHSAVMGSPDQRGSRVSEAQSFDARTMDTLMGLLEMAATGARADDVIAALEAVLTAWRKSATP